MSVLGIASSGLFGYLTQNLGAANGSTKFQQEFQQLGQDLQSGNLSAAQSDFATLQQGVSQTSSATQSSSPIAQAFSKLSQDLQSGNLTAAQSDYSTLQQDMQTQAASAHGHHRHHHGGGSENSASAVSQLLNELGSALQAGNLSSAQQAYSSLQQDLAGTSGVSVSA
jgi:outer membrane protein assembly factor BamD (BamD/ComL family)